MCGVVGCWSNYKVDAFDSRRLIEEMSQSLSHRGPDSNGVWVDEGAGLSMGHTRLAVIDTSIAGHQPMHSSSGRYVLSYNGEIYNVRKLCRSVKALSHIDWSGHSDTEVILELIEGVGVQSAVEHLNGMFAFALWDKHRSELWLGRDRFGEKPMYYGWCRTALVFSSELKALRVHPDFDAEINHGALRSYFRLGYVPAPLSIYDGVYKLKPGTLMRFKGAARGEESASTYWSAVETASRAQNTNPFSGYLDATNYLENSMIKVLESRTISDVPLGVMLSGGVDSSLIAALAQSVSSKPVKTFTIGNFQKGYDEAVHARKVAAHLGTEHVEYYVTPLDALNVVSDLHVIYDEPFSDSSQIPSVLLSRLMRNEVKVALTGDGGDELFGGYNRHVYGRRLNQLVSHVPLAVRSQLAWAIRQAGTERLNRWFSALSPIIPRQLTGGTAGYKLQKLASILMSESAESLRENIQSIWTELDDLMSLSSPQVRPDVNEYAGLDFTSQLMLGDTEHYLPDDILVKMDRASMSVGLETRAPFLDSDLFQFAWSLPHKYKIDQGQGKRILRDLLYRYVPQQLVDRPKQGFAVPIAAWIRGELRDWAEELLSPTSLSMHGLLNVQAVRACWVSHLSGKQNNDAKLWSILMFQSWYMAHYK